MDLSLLGKTPINEGQPAGSDVRYDPLYEALQAEIDNQGNPAASGGTDWKKVDRLASEILATKSKDLLVASYLAVAQLQLRKEEGVAPGLRLYRDLLEHFWENLFPPKKRMRGRVAAIEWWMEKSEPALGSLTPSPLPPEVIETYREDINFIGTMLRENLDTPVSLRVMERYIDSIPVKSETKPEPSKPVSLEVPETKPAPRPSPPPPPAETGTGEIKSASDAEKTARTGFQTVRRASDFLQNHDLSDSRSFRWRRIAGWGMVQILPPSAEGRTQIPAPMQFESVINELNTLKAGNHWEALARTSEEKFQGTVLWLDLNRYTAEALTVLGDKYQDAVTAIELETALLMHRLPGIEALTFADGTPFGNAETQAWLGQIRLKGSEGSRKLPDVDGNDTMSEVLGRARGLVGKKQMGNALDLLHQELRQSTSGQDGFRWRIHICRMLLDAKKPQLALPHLETILHDVDGYKLEEWDPNLAMQGLKIAWQGFNALSDPAAKAQTGDVFKRIAKLDLSEALQLA